MIKQIIKIIWNERSANGWLFLELVLIFSVLWFCADFLWDIGKKYVYSPGFDIAHVYNVSLGTYPESLTSKIGKEDKDKAYITIFERLKQHPAIENACISSAAAPYVGTYTSMGYKSDSTDLGGIWTKYVSSEFFDVFKIQFLEGRNFQPNDMLNASVFIVGVDEANGVHDLAISQIDSLTNGSKTFPVIGFVNKVKRSEFQNFSPIVYYPITKDHWSWNNLYKDLSIRVKPELDGPNFAKQFIEEMREQLNVSPHFLISLEPIHKQRKSYMQWTGADAKLKSVFSISAFILVNIFLGAVGTFWLRTQSRTKEIGLQMALGASKKRIKLQYILEGLLILFAVSLVGTIVTVNILATGVMDNLGIPFMKGQTMEAFTFSRLFIDYLLTTFLLAVIITLAVWYPARKAAKVSPAVVLREE